MVSRGRVYDLMRLIHNLTVVREGIKQSMRVKGQDSILSVLNRHLRFVESLSAEFPALRETTESMKRWISHLNARYGEKLVLIGPPITITYPDSDELTKAVNVWINSILEVFREPGTFVITEGSLNTLVSEKFLLKINEIAREDFKDALKCILNLIPTPAAMVSFRVAENVLRDYYTKITGNLPTTKRWAEILDDLEKEQLAKKPLLGFLNYLRDKRNEAEHPDKRFTQEEAETILLQVKGLIDEVC